MEPEKLARRSRFDWAGWAAGGRRVIFAVHCDCNLAPNNS